MSGAGTARLDRRTVALLAALLVAGACLRLIGLGEKELWYDDLDRVRVSLYDADALVHRLPYLNPLKSPLLMFLHKGWTALTGTGSLFAMRAFGALGGIACLALLFPLVRRVAGPVTALWVVAYYALDPFQVRWSVEVHNYTPGALAALVAWNVALLDGPVTRGRMAALGACTGLALGLFPPIGFALAPLILLPRVRACRDRIAWLAAAAAALVIVAPVFASVVTSWRIHRPAYAAGIAWSPYFSLRRTPFEVLARLAGLRVGQGAFAWWMAAGAAVVGGGVLAALVGLRASESRERWWRRVAVLAAGVLPFAGLALASRSGIGVFTDRYVHAASILLPAGVLVCLAPGRGRALPVRAASLLTIAVVALPLLIGLPRPLAGTSFPRASVGYRFACNGLFERVVAEEGRAPDRIFVHGEAPFAQLWIRSPSFRTLAGRARHLTTSSWLDVARRHDTGQVSIPRAYGWPFALEELTGALVTTDYRTAAEEIARGGVTWIVVERQLIRRQRHLEELEETNGMDTVFEALGETGSDDATARMRTGLIQALSIDTRRFDVELVRDRGALLAQIRPRD